MYFSRLWLIAREDAAFRRAIGVQLLCGMMGMATPFYVIYGLKELGFGEMSVGIFTSAHVAGGILSALLMGYLGVKRGTRSVMRVWGVFATCTPLVALAVPLAAKWIPGPVSMYAYAIVFVIAGGQGNSVMAGFRNYVLELAPASNRAMYIGLANTLNGLLLLAPLLGGWLLSAGCSYPALFVITAVGPLAGIFVSLSLVEPRHR